MEQLSFIDSCSPSVATKEQASLPIYYWQSEIREKSTSSQISIFDEEDSDHIELFRSGVSSKSDLLGVMKAKCPVCVSILETSSVVRDLLSDYTETNSVLCDSGAFSAFKRTIKTGIDHDIDFEKVYRGYFSVLCGSRAPGNLIYVAPDVVGQQSESISIFTKYLDDSIYLLNAGTKLLIPLQKGKLPLEALAKYLLSLIPMEHHSQVIFGLPSNAKAISGDEVIRFINDFKPKAVHFLGCSQTQLAYRAKHSMPSIQVSCDANRIRKWVGKGKLLTEMHTSVLDEVIENAWVGSHDQNLGYCGEYDYTDFLGYLDDFIESAPTCKVQRLAKKLGCTLLNLTAANRNGHLIDFLDGLNFGYSDHLLYQFYENELRLEFSPKVRSFSVSKLAEHGLI